MSPEALLAVLDGLSTPNPDPHADPHGGPGEHPRHRAEVVATVATVCPDCGEDYDELGATSRCRERHELRLTPAGRELFHRGRHADPEARAQLARAKRAAKRGDVGAARDLLEAIPTHRWGLAMVNRLRAAACASCGLIILTGDEDDRVAGSVRADPWRLSHDGETAAIVLGRRTWRLWGSWPSYRAVERIVGLAGPTTAPLAPAGLGPGDCVVVPAHVCGTRLDGEPIRAAIAHTRPEGEVPF